MNTNTRVEVVPQLNRRSVDTEQLRHQSETDAVARDGVIFMRRKGGIWKEFKSVFIIFKYGSNLQGCYCINNASLTF